MKSIRSRAPRASSAAVRRVMQANVGRETAAEEQVRRFLHKAGLRYRKDIRPIQALRCAADVVFTNAKLCIFIDGCFWHGCPIHFHAPRVHAGWWAEKIQANRERDRRNDRLLRAAGWRVVRMWEHEISDQKLTRLVMIVRRRMGTLTGPRVLTLLKGS